MGHQDHELPFVHGPPPPAIERRTVTVEPHASLAYDSDHWTDALVLLTEGNLQLEDLSGREWQLGRGPLPGRAAAPTPTQPGPGHGRPHRRHTATRSNRGGLELPSQPAGAGS